MMKNSFFSSSPSHHSVHHKPKNNVVDHENEKPQQRAKLYKAYHSFNNLLKPKIQKHKHHQGIKIGKLKTTIHVFFASRLFHR